MQTLNFLNQHPLFWLITAFILGAIGGSFLNVVIHRLPIMLTRTWQLAYDEQQKERDDSAKPDSQATFNLAWPASHCPHCHTRLLTRANIPLISYIVQRGKCRDCAQPIGVRYFLVELLFACISCVLGWYYGAGIMFVATFLFIGYVIALSAIDFAHRLLPDMLTLSLLWLGLLFNLSGLFTDIQSAVIGACVGYVSFWLIYQIHHLLTGKHGMGYGDFKLYAALGAWLGWQALPLIALIASLTGLVYALLNFFNKNTQHHVIAFGPFLAIGGVVMLFFSQQIMALYLSWIL